MAQDDESELRLPEEPIDRVLGPLERFLHIEAAGGIVLVACTGVALTVANSPLGEAYHHLWETPIGFQIGGLGTSHSIEHWINDGLMALFFFVVGLEVKRELVVGELRDFRQALLPMAAALGGMIVPAAVYLALQHGMPTARGWGIPMATDIAFVVGCMAVLGPRIPHALRVMILSLAIADDIGAIMVIALGYSTGIDFLALALGIVGVGVVVALARLGVRSFGVYILFGFFIWIAFFCSGVHATIAGVILGLLTPARPYLSESFFSQLLERATEVLHGGAWKENPARVARLRVLRRATRELVSPLAYLESALHPWVSFAIMPVFALANAGVQFRAPHVTDPVAIAVALGLVVGKPLGIVLFSWIAVRARVAQLPPGVEWSMLLGGGVLCGIGFTMAIFIAGLALQGEAQEVAKVGILVASGAAAAVGMIWLAWASPAKEAVR
jgi:NhaA family Na+:H+ antiporter